MRSPNIVILSSVLSFIEEEVNKARFDQETGGLLLGAKIPNGRLITHATPPGPNALHRPGMFERDLEFSQAALNHFVTNASVDYVGEWHKHPAGMSEPSRGDKNGAIEILRDPDYRTGGILIFPIWTRVRDYVSRNVAFHQALTESFRNPVKGNFKCFPYYMDKSFEFRSFEFQIAKCNIGTDREMKKFHEDYLNSMGIKKRDGDKRGPISSKVNRSEQQTINHEIPWYKTDKGKERLITERKSFESTNCFIGAKVLPNGKLVFRFVSPRDEEIFLDVICRNDHPVSFPELFLSHKDNYKSISDLKTDRFATIVSSSILQRINKLKMDWKIKNSLMVGYIANALGFSR